MVTQKVLNIRQNAEALCSGPDKTCRCITMRTFEKLFETEDFEKRYRLLMRLGVPHFYISRFIGDDWMYIPTNPQDLIDKR